MKKSKKVVSAMLISSLMITMLGGCSDGSKTPTPTKTPTAAPTVSAPAATTTAGGTTAPTDEKLTDEKVTFRLVSVSEPTQADFNNMEFFKQLEEKTNVHIEFENYENLNYSDQKNLMLSGGALPDGFFGYNSISMDDVNKYGPMGLFIKLDDLIEQNAPNYKARLAENPLLDGLSTALDGNKYSFGTVNESDVRNFPDNLYINKAWLDKVGLQIPTTIDEYYEVLKAFKDKDPNGNGKTDEIPYEFTNYNHITGYGSFFGAFGRVDVFNTGSSPADHMVATDDKLVFTADKPEYKEAIKILQKFFKEGLFDKEGFVQEQSQFQAKMMSPEAVVGSYYGWAATGQVHADNTDQYIAIKPLKGPSGEDPHVKMRRNNINVSGTGLAISNECKNPELLVKWIDKFYEQRQTLESAFGSIGVGLTDKGDGTYDYIKDSGPNGETYMEMRGQITPGDGAPKYLTSDMYGTVIPLREDDAEKIEVINQYYKTMPIDMTVPSINYSEAEIKINTSNGLDISNLVKEKQSKWLLGEEDIDKDWDAYIAQLNKLGLEKFMTSMQAAYDRTMGK